MFKPLLTAAAVLAIATTAVAHADVKNPAVKLRMDTMGKIAGSAKILGGYAQGKTAYDQAGVDAAAATLLEQAKMITTVFAPNEDDPKSEATPAIWETPDDFAKEADALIAAATKVDAATSQEELGAAIGGVFGTCKSCHQGYKAKR